MTRRQIPAFGNWDYCDELPITQYFESAAHAGLMRSHSGGRDGELHGVASGPVDPAIYRRYGKVRKGGGEEKLHQRRRERRERRKRKQVRMGQGIVAAEIAEKRPERAPKAVDEDLYKIPPELLCQKPKRNWFLKSVWPACLGVNRIA